MRICLRGRVTGGCSTMLVALAVVLAGGPAPAAAASAASTLSGSGTSLVAPVLAEWAQAYQVYYGTQVSYTSPGDTAGIQALSQRTVDFAASDAPMTAAQSTACHGCAQVPWALSAIGIGYNVTGVPGKLHLTGAALADIYLGKVTRWDDSEIKALNPGLKLPHQRITPIYARSSGDTLTFTTYLAKVSSAWRSKVGAGSQVQFPTGISTTGGTGMTTLLERTAGAIAYIGVPYLISHNLPAAAIRNEAGKFVYPNLANIGAAGATVKTVPASNALNIIDPPRSVPGAYPISAYMYAIVAGDSKVKVDLAHWISYALGQGQGFDDALDYARLPAVVVRASEATLRRYSP